MKTDKQRRAQFRKFRKLLGLKRVELAALAGVNLEAVARYERCKRVLYDTDARIAEAIFRTIAKRNPEAVRQAVQPALEAAEKWERVLSLEPGSELALQVEKMNGKSLAELKAQAENIVSLLRGGAKIGVSLTE